MTAIRRPRRGLVLGKFMPPHLGHCYLVDFARAYVDEPHARVISRAALQGRPPPAAWGLTPGAA